METTCQRKDFFILDEVQVIYKPKFKISTRPVVKKSADTYQILLQCWDMDQIQLKEQCKVLLFNRANRLLGIHELSSGGIAGTVADPRLIFSVALKTNSSSIIMAHNHPGGDLVASTNDIYLTQKIKEAGAFLEILLLDHLIITNEGYLSMADQGLL